MGASRSWSHERDWLGAPGDVAAARWFIADRLHGHGLSNVVDDAQLVVSELATNAVLHAGTAFRVTLTRDDGHVQITVADGGPMPTETSWPSTAHGLGGRGLMMVDHLSSDWGVITNIDGGKSVWATLSL
jgi:anti-sigma regulatory factor (Ser/Thr protein kinase)